MIYHKRCFNTWSSPFYFTHTSNLCHPRSVLLYHNYDIWCSVTIALFCAQIAHSQPLCECVTQLGTRLGCSCGYRLTGYPVLLLGAVATWDRWQVLVKNKYCAFFLCFFFFCLCFSQPFFISSRAVHAATLLKFLMTPQSEVSVRGGGVGGVGAEGGAWSVARTS